MADADSPTEQSRQLARVGAKLFTELASAVNEIFSHEPISALVFLAIVRQEFGASGGRGRSVSTRVLAQTLDLPFETVRRHVRSLRQAGICETTPDGARIPASVYLLPDIRRSRARVWAAARVFMEDAARIALVGSVPIGDRLEETPGARRIVVDYFLDALAAGRKTMSLTPVQLFVWRAIWLANNRAFLDEPQTAADFAALDQVPGDALRLPVSAYAVAKILSLPYETVRRTTAGLVKRQIVEVRPTGLIIPARVSATPSVIEMTRAIAQITGLLIQRLTEGAMGLRQAG